MIKLFRNIRQNLLAKGDKENYDRAKNSGAKEFFTKPIDFESLRKEIGTLID